MFYEKKENTPHNTRLSPSGADKLVLNFKIKKPNGFG